MLLVVDAKDWCVAMSDPVEASQAVDHRVPVVSPVSVCCSGGLARVSCGLFGGVETNEILVISSVSSFSNMLVNLESMVATWLDSFSHADMVRVIRSSSVSMRLAVRSISS